jgi:hypothetical protein
MTRENRDTAAPEGLLRFQLYDADPAFTSCLTASGEGPMTAGVKSYQPRTLDCFVRMQGMLVAHEGVVLGM